MENVIKGSQRRSGPMKNIKDAAKGDHGPDQQIEIKEECEESTDGKLMAENLMAALPQKDEKRKTDERLKRRHEHTPSADQLDVARDVFPIRLVQSTDFGFFLTV